MSIKIIENCISLELISKIREYSYSKKECRTNLTSWNPSLVSTSGTVLLFDLKEMLFNETKKELIKHIGEEHKEEDWSIIYTLGSRFSWLPWHDDGNHKKSMTIYLNDLWEKDFSGWFLYDESGETKAILPSFNKGILLSPPVNHCTVMPNLQAPLRESLQIFVNKEKV